MSTIMMEGLLVAQVTEVTVKAQRRRFAAAEKLRILREADRCTKPGEFPDRFGSPEHGRRFCSDFFPWCNSEHHHVGLGLFTPHDVHYGLAVAKCQQRARVLAEAFAKNPERFPNGLPQPKAVPTAVWINPPVEQAGPGRGPSVSRETRCLLSI